jgi:hypothetical protein
MMQIYYIIKILFPKIIKEGLEMIVQKVEFVDIWIGMKQLFVLVFCHIMDFSVG